MHNKKKKRKLLRTIRTLFENPIICQEKMRLPAAPSSLMGTSTLERGNSGSRLRDHGNEEDWKEKELRNIRFRLIQLVHEWMSRELENDFLNKPEMMEELDLFRKSVELIYKEKPNLLEVLVKKLDFASMSKNTLYQSKAVNHHEAKATADNAEEKEEKTHLKQERADSPKFRRNANGDSDSDNEHRHDNNNNNNNNSNDDDDDEDDEINVDQLLETIDAYEIQPDVLTQASSVPSSTVTSSTSPTLPGLKQHNSSPPPISIPTTSPIAKKKQPDKGGAQLQQTHSAHARYNTLQTNPMVDPSQKGGGGEGGDDRTLTPKKKVVITRKKFDTMDAQQLASTTGDNDNAASDTGDSRPISPSSAANKLNHSDCFVTTYLESKHDKETYWKYIKKEHGFLKTKFGQKKVIETVIIKLHIFLFVRLYFYY
ncbi:SNF2-related domain-containing protein, partial [Reticulomyxa filosa]